VELLTAALWVVLYHRLATDTGISWANFIAHALFASILVAVIFIDLDHFIIPDELNAAGVALGLGRDVICLALAWQAGPWWFDEVRPRFLYFGWLPVSIAGALVYGGLLFLVSFLGFLYYARDEGEPLAATARRFFVYDEEEGAEEAEADGSASPGEGTGIGDDAAESRTRARRTGASRCACASARPS
jgi:prepilin signal peptidase PulO-like enzyme (type II secretory pathway)